MEKIIYLKIGEIILLIIFVAFFILCIYFAKYIDRWDEKLKNKQHDYKKDN